MPLSFALPRIPLLRRKSRLAYLRNYATAIVEEFGNHGIIMADPAGLREYYTSGSHYKFTQIYCVLNKHSPELATWVQVMEDDWTDLIPRDIADCHPNRQYPYICPSIIHAKSPLFRNIPVEDAWPMEYVPTLVVELIKRANEIEAVNQRVRQSEFLQEFSIARTERQTANQRANDAIRRFRAA